MTRARGQMARERERPDLTSLFVIITEEEIANIKYCSHPHTLEGLQSIWCFGHEGLVRCENVFFLTFTP